MSQVVVFVQGIVLYLLLYNLVQTVRRPGRVRRLVKGIRPRHVVTALGALLGTVLILVGLESIGGLFSVGWWSQMGGEGNVVAGGASSAEGHPLILPLMVLIPVALLLNIPSFAFKEEVWFRADAATNDLMENVQGALKFGLLHMLVGIPLSAALALAAFGGFLTWRFVRVAGRDGRVAALYENARIHATYNAVIVLLLMAVLSIRLFGV